MNRVFVAWVLLVASMVEGCGGVPSHAGLAATGGQASQTVRAPQTAVPNSVCLSGAKYALAYDDEFSSLAAGRYAFAYPWGPANPSAGDDAYYLPSNVTTGPNGLQLSAQPAGSPLPTFGSSTLHYTSGMLSTYPYFEPQYGYIEASLKLPRATGIWPAFWMLDKWGSANEIDIMENYNGQNLVYQTVHYGTASSTFDSYGPAGFDVGQFHRYGVQWDPGKITFYVDGTAAGSFPNNDSNPMYLLLTLQVGNANAWFGSPAPTTSWPQTMFAAYLRVYQPAGSTCTVGSSRSVGVAQTSPVTPFTSPAAVTATLPQTPAVNDTLIAFCNFRLPPQVPAGWTMIDGPSRAGFFVYSATVGATVPAQTRYTFGLNAGLIQVIDVTGSSNAPIILASSDPVQFQSDFPRSLSIPQAGGLLLSGWGAYTWSASGLQSIDEALPEGQSETLLGYTLDSPNLPGGGAFSLRVAQITSEPFAAQAPFVATGSIAVSSYWLFNGVLVWVPPA